MTAIPDSKNLIQSEEVDYRSAISENSLTKIGGAVNYIINNSTFAIGDVVTSMLTVAQFQSLRGSTWVLMDGASCVGSDYETLTSNSTVPDMVSTETFPRQADSDVNLGGLQSSQNLAHRHGQLTTGGFDGITTNAASPLITPVSPVQPLSTALGVNKAVGGSYTQQYRQSLDSATGSAPISNVYEFEEVGGVEARPNAIKLNYFIKINNS